MEKENIRKMRYFFTALGWIMILINQYLGCTGDLGCLFMYRTYTIESNLMALIWLSLSLYFNDLTDEIDPRMERLKGSIHTAIAMYITVTFLVFAILLERIYNPTGLAAFTNVIEHYIIPIYFAVDWYLTSEVKVEYKHAIVWLGYPLFYLAMDLILGAITGKYIYPFLDLPTLGIIGLLIWVVILIFVFLIVSVIYIKISQSRNKD